MPKVNVLKSELFQFIGKEFSNNFFNKLCFVGFEEFEDLCFEFGLEIEKGLGAEMSMQRVDGQGGQIDIS